jgi:hypothetical protein
MARDTFPCRFEILRSEKQWKDVVSRILSANERKNKELTNHVIHKPLYALQGYFLQMKERRKN